MQFLRYIIILVKTYIKQNASILHGCVFNILLRARTVLKMFVFLSSRVCLFVFFRRTGGTQSQKIIDDMYIDSIDDFHVYMYECMYIYTEFST